MSNELLTVADIADRAGVTSTTVSQWRYRGLLPEPVRGGGRGLPLLFDADTIDAWLTETGRR